jgi:hypothetical protein
MKAARPEHRAAPRRALPSRLALMAAIALPLLQACAVTADGYGGDVGYVGGFYEPYGYEYGGWGPDYRVGPPRGGDWGGHGGDGGDHGGHGGGGGGGGHGAPSIPGGSRGGGGHR